MADAVHGFALDPRLVADTQPLTELPLSRLLLMDNAHYPWLILVPRRDGMVEITDLVSADRVQLAREVEQVAELLTSLHPEGKLNLGALGNIVSQLHVHLVIRREGDAAWPAPVWGGPRIPYEPGAREAMAKTILKALHRA